MHKLKYIGAFVVKAVSFSLIFWGLWLFILKPITSPAQNTNTSSQDAQSKALMETYEEQAMRTDELLNSSDAQQKRMELLLTIQEEQARRYNLILDKWEKQAGIKK